MQRHGRYAWRVRGTEEEEYAARWKTFCVVNLNTYMESVFDTVLD
jgi:hypothetical protein